MHVQFMLVMQALAGCASEAGNGEVYVQQFIRERIGRLVADQHNLFRPVILNDWKENGHRRFRCKDDLRCQKAAIQHIGDKYSDLILEDALCGNLFGQSTMMDRDCALSVPAGKGNPVCRKVRQNELTQVIPDILLRFKADKVLG